MGRRLAALLLALMALLPRAAHAQAINFRSDLPRTLVLISEDDQPRIAFREVTTFLRAARFPLVDPALVSTVASRSLLQAALDGDKRAAIQLGRDFGAHLLVLGRAEWDQTLDNSTERRETRTAQITLRAIRLDRGTQVATAQGRGSAVDGNGQRARTRAVRYAIQEIVQRSEFVGALANNWDEVPWSNEAYFRQEGSPVSPPAANPVSSPVRVPRQWAVVVGVAEYRNPGIPAVPYAARDAQALREFLQSAAGAVAPDHVLFLTNEQATLRALRAALFGFLQQAEPEDVVLIYFAGHGVPDPARPENLFLLPYDADLTALPSTGLPLWDLKTALRRHIRAERVVVFSDVYQSGGVPNGAANPINRAFEDLITPSNRLALIAGRDNQPSQAHERWGGGHGVFTFSLLEGLRGAADHDHDSLVTFAELADYVIGSVTTATAGQQSPVRLGQGDLPLSNLSALSTARR